MGINKVSLEGTPLIDLSEDTLQADSLVFDHQGYNALGERVDGAAQGDNEDALLTRSLQGAYYNPNVTKSHHRAFMNNTQLTKLYLPNLDILRSYSCYGCTNLEDVQLDKANCLQDYAFYGCSSLSSFNDTSFPNVTSIMGHCFQSCTSLTEFSSSKVWSLSPVANNWNSCSVFKNCTSLRSVDIPYFAYAEAREGLFYGCSNLTSVNLPLLNYLTGGVIFYGCSNLPGIVLPCLGKNQYLTTGGSIPNQCFQNCTKLEYVDVNSPAKIEANAFYNASKLNTLIIRGPRVTTLDNINAFTNSPFASGKAGGILYVPESLISDYQAATNWTTILGYETNDIKAIEGSYYETHYADGRLISEVVIPYPSLISLNGTWDYGDKGSITVTNNNHITLNALKDYGGSSNLQIWGPDPTKPIFSIPTWSKLTMLKPTSDDIQVNGNVQFNKQDGTAFYTFYGNSSTTTTGNTANVDIYSIGFKKYWKGTREYDLEVLLNNVRII